MSGVAVIRYLLANNAPLLSVIPVARIASGTLPLNTTLPAISVTQVDGSEYRLMKRNGAQLVTERVQVSVLAITYPTQKSILALVRSAIPATRGVVNSVTVDSVDYAGDGPDIFSESPLFYLQSADFMVRFIR